MIIILCFIILAIIGIVKHTLLFYSHKIMTKSVECEM